MIPNGLRVLTSHESALRPSHALSPTHGRLLISSCLLCQFVMGGSCSQVLSPPQQLRPAHDQDNAQATLPPPPPSSTLTKHLPRCNNTTTVRGVVGAAWHGPRSVQTDANRVYGARNCSPACWAVTSRCVSPRRCIKSHEPSVFPPGSAC